MDLKEALLQLDALNDDHWTGNGDPLITAVEEFTGFPVSRKEVIDVAPDYTRKSAGDGTSMLLPKEEDEGSAVPEKEKAEEVIPVSDDDGASLMAEFVDENYDDLNQEDMNQFVSEVSDEDAVAGIVALEKVEAGLSKDIANLTTKQNKIRLLKKMVRLAINARQPTNTNQQAIRDYIKSQYDERSRKSDVMKGFQSFDLSSMDPRSKLDQVMAQKPKPGSKRPERI